MEVGNLTHSHSHPGEMDRTPPGTPKRGGKMLAVRVQMLDDTVTMFQIQAKALGRVLFDQVCNQLNLLESDYFGLEYQEAGGTKYWLDLEKPVCRQIGLSLVDILVKFCVKFYTPDPSQLEEEFTRYLFCLQIKRDLSQGLLQCNNNTAALMASYIVQAECGDYVVEDYPDHRYLSSYKFVPNQDQELERRIMENHKKHAGQSPAEADLNLLETARRCELYGIKMHPAKDHEGCPLNLAVAHMGIVVFQNYSKINTFSWAKIRKISFKRKRFLVKLHPEGYGYYKDTVEFFFEGRNECKNFWKKCVENHGFFRCTMVKKVPRQKTRVLSRGSSFRYSGRTQKQIVDFVRENYVKRQTFQRSQSFRHSSSAHSSVANVGTSISAHPLLPLGDNAVVGTPASLSCGSMTLTSSPVHTADIHAGASPSPPLTTSVSPGTSVTSSPQHVYPQETPYPRTGHRPMKMKRPLTYSHHAISPLLSPTDAATAVGNRSANRSNELGLDARDKKSLRDNLKSPEFIDFNDVYSNCYASLRSLRNEFEGDVVIKDETKTDIFQLADEFLNGTIKSNDSIETLSKKSKVAPAGSEGDSNRYTWHRSASCKDLYREGETERRNVAEADSVMTRRNGSRRKCYSAAASKSASVERAREGGGDLRIYSSSYPGTTSSVSTESVEGELEERIAEVLDVKYDSQEEIALSHDDVSHDSYELLERELEVRNGGSAREKVCLMIGESERTRSCSWGSDRGLSLMDFRSAESGIGSGCDVSREQNFWSLEKERNSKHKSESDFRSLNSAGSLNQHFNSILSREEGCFDDGTERHRRTREFLNYDVRFDEIGGKIKEEMQWSINFKNPSDNRVVAARGFVGGKESFRGLSQNFELERLKREGEESFEGLEKQKHLIQKRSIDDSREFYLDLLDSSKEVSLRADDKKKMDKRREKKEREERFHEGLKEKEEKELEKEKEKERERKQMNRKRSASDKEELPVEGEVSRKILPKPSEYGNFQEIQFKKFDRVVSNQFGRYSEFLAQENNFFAQEKVLENYDKVQKVSKTVKEIKSSFPGPPEKCVERIEKMNKGSVIHFEQQMKSEELKSSTFDHTSMTDGPRSGSRVGRVLVERTKSDPYNPTKSHRKSILMHQKSIDLTPQQSEETASDYDNEDSFKKASRSEHDIPYILRKRHCMNGTARNTDLIFSPTNVKSSTGYTGSHSNEGGAKISKTTVGVRKFVSEEKRSTSNVVASVKQRPSSAKVAEAKRAGVQIINLDARNGKVLLNVPESKKIGKCLKSPTGRKPADESKTKAGGRKEGRKAERSTESVGPFFNAKEEITNTEKCPNALEEVSLNDDDNEDHIYAEVYREESVSGDESTISQKKLTPQPPKRTSSFPKRFPSEETSEKGESSASKREEGEEDRRNGWEFGVGAGDLRSTPGRGVHRRREESLTLFARTRLGLSEGSAFSGVLHEGAMGSPTCQRRAKSLDAPYVSVHSLPPADAFSSKDDTVEGSEGDIVNSAVIRLKDIRKGEGKNNGVITNGVVHGVFDGSGNTESEVDSVFTDDIEVDNTFKKTVLNQSKVEISFSDEKVLDSVRSKRLLSKIESVDFIDSEGDMDSSKVAEPPVIPSDRLVNLPESIRFPSVRQISGQTSEESVDGWDQKEVKVKRRTPRRSVGREEQDVRGDIPRESVVWDSKDEEPPDENVWKNSLAVAGKYDGAVVNVDLPVEYLKRGSCGQSIDDDNLSTPMKESSPEHWVSVDDLPEALEREEKLLKQQEKILREKILNEKLKRELNLDTIDVDERYSEYRDNVRQSKYEEESTSLKENFKGHSLDTYELNEKKSRERKGNKSSTSLDEELLPNRLTQRHTGHDLRYKVSTRAFVYRQSLDYIQCKVVKDVAEIEQFDDNDEELEEFFVVLDENLDREGKSLIWGVDESLRRTLSNDESLISVPEQFKDVEKEREEQPCEGGAATENGSLGRVEIRLSEFGGKGEGEVGHVYTCLTPTGKSIFGEASEEGVTSTEERSFRFGEGGGSDDTKAGLSGDIGGLSPFTESRRGSEENRKLSLSEDTGRLSPYDGSSRRSSDEPRRLSASEETGRLSPFADSRRGSEDPRRLSTSEDSRKCSASESISEETRRRLSSTEETRRKRASLTKQCSVGADSLSDEMISGIQECSSSFEHDEKDVFEPEIVTLKRDDEETGAFAVERTEEQIVEESGCARMQLSEAKTLGVSLKSEKVAELVKKRKEEAQNYSFRTAALLAPPSSDRELSRETEDSVDYGEGDFKDIRDTVKEKDMSEDLISYGDFLKPEVEKSANFSEKNESFESDEFHYIDEKRGSTPEIIIGNSKEAIAMSIVVVNEGISVLDKINEKDRKQGEGIETQSLPKISPVDIDCREQRHTLPKTVLKPKSLTPKPLESVHRKLMKTVPEINIKVALSPTVKESPNLVRSSLDSSQESDLDRLSDISLVSHVQNQIARKNLSDAGKFLRKDDFGTTLSGDSGSWKTSSEEDGCLVNQKTSSEEKEKTDQSSADEFVAGEKAPQKGVKMEKSAFIKGGLESSKGKWEGVYGVGREKRSHDQEKRDSGEDGSSSSSAPLCPKRELSSTWKPFLLESSGSSSLEEGWLPPDESAHLADEEETSSTSNNQQDESYHDDAEYPTGFGYPVLSVTSAEMMVSGYGSVYALSRTLSRISERSMSEQDRSDLEDDITKPSSHSASVEEESILSSDHQPSLSSDPPSPKESASAISDLPVDRPLGQWSGIQEDKPLVCEPFGDVIPAPVTEEDWPSPPSSSSVMDTPVVSHIETFYMEIHPEEACKVVVAKSRDEGNSSSDENHTLQEESEFLVLSSDNVSASTTTTTQDGTVIIPVRSAKSGKRGSLSEDASVISVSERSGAACTAEDPLSLERQEDQSEISHWVMSPSKYCPEQESQKSKVCTRVKPLKLSSPTAKTLGFFETPVSKVRSPTSQMKFFDSGDRGIPGYSSLRSTASFLETPSPKNHGLFFDGPAGQIFMKVEASERRTPKSPTKVKGVQRAACTHYSNVADHAEKSYFGRYDTGSLERTKIQSSRKCFSYYSVSRTAPSEGDGSNSDGPTAPSPNTIPRASRKSRKRHRVAMDLVVRDGRIVAPPKTNATVVENSDSDRSSPSKPRLKSAHKTCSDV